MARPSRASAPGFRRRIAAVAALGLAVLPLQALGAGPAAAAALVRDPAALVNPIIGTSGSVDTFPGPDMPFGMLQWGPDTTPDRPDGGGYEYKDSKISGYSLTHLSGPGCPAGGDVPMLPVTGDLSGNLSDAASTFSHDDEQTGIGRYGVTDASGITTELASATRAGLGRFTFPGSSDSHLLLKLSGGATQVDGTRARVVNDHEVVGAVQSGHFCGASNRYTLHFDIRFNHPFTGTGTWVDDTINENATSLELGRPRQNFGPQHATNHLKSPHFTLRSKPSPNMHGPASHTNRAPVGPPVTGANGMYLTFDTTDARSVTAAVGISYTSDANARGNLAAEIRGWNLGALRKASHDAWNRVLGRVRIGGGSHDEQVRFYTALYHSLLHPNVFSDSNGEYMGMDDQVHRLAKGQRAQYANYSGWDIYRSQVQLMATVAPGVAGDVVTSMLNGYDQTGLLPKWAQNNGESYVMVGDPAAAIIADAYAFGARGFDTAHALDALVHEATKPNNNRPGEQVRQAKGYLPIDGKDWGCCNFYGPVSTQQEYDVADYAVASLAKSLGHDDVYARFAARAQDWQNVFNPRSGYLQARTADGEFAAGFTPATSDGFVEGTSAQYTPMVPFNLKALIAARGGPAAYGSYLDGLLSNITQPTGINADLSNEPSIEIPWEYDYTGQPWKAQAVLREAEQKLWFNAPVGSFGNDDLGEMSSWYVWAELGMYPETPGTDVLALGSPSFPQAELTLGDGSVLRINAPQAAPDAPYVQQLSVNGQRWDKAWLGFGSLAHGGSLDYALGSSPNTGWASSPDAAPPSDATGQREVLASAGPSGAGLVIEPGATGTGTLDLANIGNRDITVKWTAQAPAGVRLDAASGEVAVPAGGKAQQRVKVTADGGDKDGVYPVRFALTTAAGAPLGGAVLRAVVAQPDALWPYFTGDGVYADGETYTGGFDGAGWSYSRNALEEAGVSSGMQLQVDGVSYTWPQVASGSPDNITMAGQTIPVGSPDDAGWLGLLGAGTNAPKTGSRGEMTITYTDGSTDKYTIGFSDWTLDGGSSTPVSDDATLVTTPYRNSGQGGRENVKTYVFATKVPLDRDKRVASITLPVTADGQAHVFALGFGA